MFPSQGAPREEHRPEVTLLAVHLNLFCCQGWSPGVQFVLVEAQNSSSTPLRGRFLHAAHGAVLGARPALLWHFSLRDLPHLWVSDTATSESKSTGIAEPTQTAF